MAFQKKTLILAMAATFVAPLAQAADETQTQEQAATQLQFSNQLNLSGAATPDVGDDAFKTKLVRLGNGVLITVFGDSVDSTKLVYDVKGDVDRPARDIFIRTCASSAADCSLEESWSEPENVSGTALLSSMNADWDGPETDGATRKPYYGDSDKPNISNGGSNIMVTWTDKYCDALAEGSTAAIDTDPTGTSQRSVAYLTRDNREVPFSCAMARYATVAADGSLTWGTATPVQLSTGARDAKQDVSKVNSLGKAVVTWQEDPLGLQLGSADGPGDGASGATASHGTDIWYTTTTNTVTKTDPDTGKAIAGKTAAFTNVARLTDNATSTASGNHNVIRNAAGVEVADDAIEGGQASATRANTALVGSTVVVAYEETKGSEGLAIGKFVRYHTYSYNTDPQTQSADAAFDKAGCIISNPLENARRVRFVAQTDDMMAQVNAVQGDVDSGLRMGIFWKEGQYDQGGPSDIMARVAIGGVDATDMVPAVDANCATSDYLTAEDLSNTPAYNLSSNTKAGTNNLTDTTETNNIENALAHRGAIVGNDLYVGYSYTTDWALATYTNLVNYDFWLRRYDGTTGEWTAPKNLSNLPTTDINVREPRFVKTPYSATAEDAYNPSAFVIAWGTQTNVASHIEDAEDLDIYYTRSFDKGVTMEPVVRVDNPNGNARYESQLRPTPNGETVYAVWNETDGTNTEAAFSVATTTDAVDGYDPYDDGSSGSSGSGGGCTLSDNAKFDPVLPAILASALAFLGFRRYRNQA
ncbi:choice-of-anchor O protein [Thiomicrorhabdus sp. zzn3]|uniref:choice-of-anchor O protein n=1 Tax=Thiomicrorhabdus sp. zzn3 TaxID=3039775 RepID=UPI002436DD79|nr:choice-of-anchor O protein [Thiomicrorhabdus sp. zzn3]MDG6777160.1 choice-of-anchor O protein [Thiomicrorhabdus sp. zzn3]